MKKILCVTYRDWACNIYDALQEVMPNINFKIIRTKEDYDESIIDKYDPDIILWYGWSWIVPEKIINKYTSLCLHPSPLPQFRGGSPIQNQIIRNIKISAVSIFKMDNGMDSGDIIDQVPLSLLGDIPAIFTRMTDIGFTSTYKILTQLERGEQLKLYKQNEDIATEYERRKPSQSEITIDELQNNTVEHIHNKIRMLTGLYPSAYINGKNGNKLFITGAKL